jgi:hypothetical protein
VAQTVLTPEMKQLRELCARLPLPHQRRLVKQVEQLTKEIDQRIRRLLRPRAMKDGEGYLVADAQGFCHGVGATKEAAFADYRDTLRESYEILAEKPRHLSDHLQQEFALLRAIFDGEGGG